MHAFTDADVVVTERSGNITISNRIPRYLIIRERYRSRSRSIIYLVHARRRNSDGALSDVGGRIEGGGSQRVVAGIGARDGNDRNMHRLTVSDRLRIEVGRIGNSERIAGHTIVGERHGSRRRRIVGLVGVPGLKDMQCP